MTNFVPSVPLWIWVGLQFVGISSAWIARLSEGSAHQTRCQWLFLISLFLIGLATIAALWQRPGYWLGLAITLASMILVAICDFRRHRHSIFTLSEF